MSGARPRVLIAVILAVLAGMLALALSRQHSALSRSSTGRPTLLLLTILPLVFSDQFSLEGGSPALTALQSRYRVVPISVTSHADLGKSQLLLMAQPLAQTAENLVALDEWVRAGGHVLLLADPMLEWPSSRPLGDRLRPPPMFMDTGLLAHWGLRLDAPDRRGPQKRNLGGYDVLTVSPGTLAGACQISPDRLVADCRVGKGRAIVVADADLLDVSRLGAEAPHNLDALLAELARLDQK
jgi:hypothetical protein